MADCTGEVVGGGLCRKHYMRLRRKGTTDDVRKNARGPCVEHGCEELTVGRGLCRRHYTRDIRAEQPPRPVVARFCAHCGASAERKYRGGNVSYCSRKCKEDAYVADGRAAEKARKSYFKIRYGLTVEQVDEMAAEGCAICGTTDWPGRHNRPHVDHDHATGEVRGILCSECNTGIGKFKDDAATVLAAARYLGA